MGVTVTQAQHQTVAPPRIGSGIVFLLLGSVSLAAGVFGLLAGASGSAGAAEFGGGASALGEMLIVTGVVIGLFRKVEARLIDIQSVVLASTGQVTRYPATRAQRKPEGMGDEALMSHYGITREKDKYKLREWRYDKLSDAVAQAKLA